MRSVLVLFALSLVAGCATGPETISATRPTVSYRYVPGEERAVEQRAEAYCDNYRADARLVRSGREAGDYVAVFECR